MRQFSRRLTAVLTSICLVAQPLQAAAAAFQYQVPVEGKDLSQVTAGSLQLSNGSHGFGTLVLGSTAVTSTTLTNIGQDVVHISGLDISAPFTQSNNCPTTLIGGASCTVTVGYNPSTAGSYSAVLGISADVAAPNFTVTGAAVVPTTDLTVSPNQVAMGSSNVGTAATAKTVTITNAGNSPATVTGIGVTSGETDFAQSNNCGSQLSPGASCTVNVAFTPTVYGARSGNLNIYEAASGTLYSVALSGSGDAAVLSVAPSVVDFGSAIANYSTRSHSVTVTNVGNRDLTGLAADVSAGAFSQESSTCGAAVTAGSSCTVVLKFAPVSAGDQTSTLLVHSNGGSSTVTLKGTGVAQNPSVQASVPSLTFPGTTVATSSASQVVTFTNNGNVDVAVSSVQVTSGSSSFQATGTCGSTLTVGASCTATVVFTPAQSGAVAGSLTAGFSSGSKVIALSGTGLQGAATLSASSLTFQTTQVASSSAAQTVTVTNTGNKALTFTGIGISAGATDFAQSNNCATVAPNATCSLTVTFTPTVPGARAGTLALVHDGQGATTIALSGTGQAASSSLSTPTFAVTPVGGSTTSVATLTNTGIGMLTVTVPAVASVTGTDFSFASTTCSSTLAAGASCGVSVKFSPTSTASRTGQLTVSTTAGQQAVTLGSTGIQGYATVNPSSLTFAVRQNGSTSAAQVVTVTNTGTDTLTFTGVGVSTGAADFAQANNCGAVPVNGSCTVNVSFTPTVSGARTGTLSFTHNGGGIANISLTGSGQAASGTLSSVAYGNVLIGSTSTLSSTLTNTGIGTLTMTVPSAASVSGTAFNFASTTCASSLAAGASCQVAVTFAPSSGVASTGSLAVSTGAGTLNSSLSGTGTGAILVFSPSTDVVFADQQVGQTRTSTGWTLVNNGNAAATNLAATLPQGFSLTSNTCGTSLAAGASCTTTVVFSPVAAQVYSGNVVYAADAPATSASRRVQGAGVAASATLSNAAFGTLQTGSSSTLTSTLTNTGIGPVNVTAPAAASVVGTDFAYVGTTCPATLAAGASCTVSVSFAPTAAQARSGTLSVVTTAATLSANLSGAGQAPSATLSTPTFANDYSGDASGQLATATLANTGIDAIAVTVPSAASVTGTDFSFVSTTCSTSLAAGASCTVTLNFIATAGGARSGNLSFATGAGTKSAALAGTGIAPTATLSTPSFASTPVNSTSTATATLSNTGAGPLTVTVPAASSVTGTGFSFVSTTCPASMAVSATCTVTVQFAPTSTAAATGTLSIGTAAGTKMASLGSTGIQGYASVSPSSLTFSAQQTTTTSGSQVVTVTNTGTNTLTFSGVGISVGSADFAQSNNCGAVAVNGTCTVNVTFTPSTTGSRTGTLSFTHNGGGIANVSLTGTGQAPSATLSAVAFGSVVVGGSSTLTSTLTNTGLAAISVTVPTAASVTGTDYSFVSTTCASSLAASSTCTVSVKLSPTAAAARSGSLSFATGAGTQTAALSGTGIQGYATLSPGSLSFSAQQVSSTSAAQTVTVTNTGSSPLTISGVSVTAGSADFGQSNSCGSALAVNGTCTISVSFTPSTTGTRTGTVSFANNGGGVTSFSVSGTGQAQSASISSYAAGSVVVGGSTSGSVTLTNTGIGTLSLTAPSSASVSGTDFSFVSTTCGSTLGAGGACTVSVRFAPSANAARSGSVAISTGAGTQTASLSGTGIQGTASYSAGSLAFSSQTIGSTAGSQSITITNSGSSALTVSGVSVTAGGSDFAQSNNCGSAMAVNASCTINVSFTPAAAGARSGTIGVTTNGSNGNGSISLSGTGVATASSSIAINGTNGATVTTGSAPTVSWSTSNASSVSVSCSAPMSYSYSGGTVNYGGGGVGTSGTGTSTCSITPYNSLGVAGSSASAVVYVVAAPSVTGVSFGAANVTSGSANTVNWSTSGATSVSVSCSGTGAYSYSGGTVNYNGAGVSTSSSGTATCSVTAYNAAGSSASGSNTFQVVAAPSVTGISFGAGTVTSGNANTVNWSTSGATSVAVSCSGTGAYSYSGGTVNYNGAGVSTSSAGTATCSVTAYNAAGSAASASNTFQVVAAPAVTGISFGAGTVTSGNANTVNWSTSNATSVAVSCSGTGSYSYSGTTVNYNGAGVATSGTGTATCSVTAYNAAGNSSGTSATFQVVAPATVQGSGYTFFSPATVTAGYASTFAWQTSGATSASVSCSGAGASATGSGTTGSISVGTGSAGPATCVVTAYNAAGNYTQASTQLNVVAAPSASGNFSSSSVNSGTAVTYTWSTSNATSASVSCSGQASGSGSGTSGSISVATSGVGTGYCTVTAYNAAASNNSTSSTSSVTVNTASAAAFTVAAPSASTWTFTNPNAFAVTPTGVGVTGIGASYSSGTCSTSAAVPAGGTCTVNGNITTPSCGTNSGRGWVSVNGGGTTTGATVSKYSGKTCP